MLKTLKKVISKAMIVMMVVMAGSLMSINVAFAAAGEGTATIRVGTGGTGADDATYGAAGASGTVTVGTLSYLRFDITVGASHIAAAEDNVTIQVNTNLFPTNGFDTNEEAALGDVDAVGEFFIGYTDTDSGTTDNSAISFAGSDAVNTGEISVQADQQMDATDIISVYVAVNDTNNVLAAAAVDIETDDTGGTPANIAAQPTIATQAAVDGTAAITFGANSAVGAAGVTTITLTTPFALDPNDTIDITFPDYVDITGAPEVATGTFDNGDAATITCDDTGQVLTCTVTVAGTATTGTIILSGITTKYVGTTDITSFEVENEGVAANDIVVETTVALTDTTVGALTSTNVQPDSLAILTYSTNTISFTTTATIPNLGKIKITYPSGWDVSAVDGDTAGDLSGLDGTWTASVSGQVITLTQTGGTASTAGAKSLTLEEIKTPGTTGSGGTYTILTEIAAGDDVQTATVTADTLIGKTGNSGTSFDAITGFEATQSDDGILLTWDDPSDSSTLIQVLKGTGASPVNGTAYQTVALGVEEYLDTNVEEGETYKYKVRGTDGNTNGTATDTLTIVYTGSGGASAEVSEEEVAEEGAAGEETATEETGAQAEEETSEESGVPFSESGEFTDISGHWGAERIQAMAEAGIVHGDPDGSFRPDDSLNRAEAAALLHRVLGMEEAATPGEKPFSDVEVGVWYSGYVSVLKSLSLVNGNPDGTYKPGANINRAEFLHLALNVYYYLADDDVKAMIDGVRAETTNPFVDVSGDAYYVSTVRVAHQMEFVEGVDCEGGKCFNPASDITRAEATKILYEMFFAADVDGPAADGEAVIE